MMRDGADDEDPSDGPTPERRNAVGGSDDPSVVRTIAVHADDVVTAHEASVRRDVPAVLRVTPPFSGRMRARLHVETPGEYDDASGPIPFHLRPAELLDEDVPPFPTPMDTEDELSAERGSPPDSDDHREYHAAAVERWREDVVDHVRDGVSVDAGETTVVVDVVVLG